MSIIELSNITQEKAYVLTSDAMVNHFFTVSMDEMELAQNFTLIMDKAREYGVADEVFALYHEQADQWSVPELWQRPEPFSKKADLMPFPLSCLPQSAGNYLKEVTKNIQVSPDMGALPLLSMLSLCTQGKAVIKNPGGGNTETLNLYTLTVAKAGERKSGVLKALSAPIYNFQKEENERREPLIREYKLNKSMLTKQLDSVTKGKGINPERAKELSKELEELDPVYPLTLNVNDTTPEALVTMLSMNDERIGILNDEGGVLDVLAGLYSSGVANIDLFLKAYDGSPYNVIRCTREPMSLDNPLITFGLMSQYEPFERAMNNPQFSGRGLVHRFLYAFPDSHTGQRDFTSLQISEKAKQDYSNLIYKLLNIRNTNEIPVISCDKEAFHVFSDYHYSIEDKLKNGGMFEYMKEWGNKQLGRALKIAGLLHLCEHDASEPLGSQTALNAVSIAMWSENQALRAFGEIGVSEEETTAKYVLNRIRTVDKLEYKKTEIWALCKKLKTSEEFEKPLEMLEDMGYIRKLIAKTGGRPSEKYKINPFIRLYPL